MAVNVGGLNASYSTVTKNNNWGTDVTVEGTTYKVPYGIYFPGTANNVRNNLNSKLYAVYNDAKLNSDEEFTVDFFEGGNGDGTSNPVSDVSGLSFTSDVGYWSSSEWSAGNAFYMNFNSNGNLNFERNNAKSNAKRVRPVLATIYDGCIFLMRFF